MITLIKKARVELIVELVILIILEYLGIVLLTQNYIIGTLLIILAPVSDVLLTSRMDVREDVRQARQRLEETQRELDENAQQAGVIVDKLAQKLEKMSQDIFGFGQSYHQLRSLEERVQFLEKQIDIDQPFPSKSVISDLKRDVREIKRKLGMHW